MPHLNVSLEFSVLILSSWYIGSIAGSIVSAALLNRVKKKTIYVSFKYFSNLNPFSADDRILYRSFLLDFATT